LLRIVKETKSDQSNQDEDHDASTNEHDDGLVTSSMNDTLDQILKELKKMNNEKEEMRKEIQGLRVEMSKMTQESKEMKHDMVRMLERVDALGNEVKSVKAENVELHKAIYDLKASLEFSQHEIDTLKENMKSRDASVKSLTDNIDYLENASRRNNIRVDGLPEDRYETWDTTEMKLRNSFVTQLGLSEVEAKAIAIDRAHRTGQVSSQRIGRTIIARLGSFKDKEMLMKKSKEVKPLGYFVNEDFSARVAEKRRALWPQVQLLRAQGKIAYLSFDKLIVKDPRPRSFHRPGPSPVLTHQMNPVVATDAPAGTDDASAGTD